ncbi:penicillin-binding protein 2 [Candidatus Uhrbacteria bacterium]|nr:penicillin-binding protein 2 [Candidatus Uhrbacteria bacterium]
MLQQVGSRRMIAQFDYRYRLIFAFFLVLLACVVIRLGYLQIMEHGLYGLYASDQHDLQKKLLPTRGRIFLRDAQDGSLTPLATNRLSWQVYAVPRDMPSTIIPNLAKELAIALHKNEADVITQLTKRPDDPYELLAKDVSTDVVDHLRSKNLTGIGFVKMTARMYPERGLGGQLIGFVQEDEQGVMKGRYGIEGSFEDVLSGVSGSLIAEKDASGRRLIFGDTQLREAKDGSDIVLTIDRGIQFKACMIIQEAVKRHQADDGTIMIMDPQTGAVMAMCSAPDFEPANYGETKNLRIFNNPATFVAYEPGSIFKAFTMAAGLDAEKINPKTIYNDTGKEEIDDFTIRNSDKKAHGVQTMTYALDESLNTATIFVQRLLGKDRFRQYVELFGFGKQTGIGLNPEVKADISGLSKKGSIFAATGSFGQGLTTTPIQLVAGYGALANNGKLMRPYIVAETIHPDGTREKTKPLEVAQPISSRASRLVTGMLISAVENGHGKRASVPGYWVAGKTGTAQVPKKNGKGYETDVTIGSFAGFAPANDPRFVMLVKITRPRDVQWAESSAAPVFGEMAAFLLSYLRVPPERTVKEVKLPPLPTMPLATTTTNTVQQ